MMFCHPKCAFHASNSTKNDQFSGGEGQSQRVFHTHTQKVTYAAEETLLPQITILVFQCLTFSTRVRFSCFALRYVTMRQYITPILSAYFICTVGEKPYC